MNKWKRSEVLGIRLKMPGLSRKSLRCSSSSFKGSSRNARHTIWNCADGDNISFSELRKFWSELPLPARRELLRIDKVTLFERVRRNFYCSRCHGLLVEGFSQILLYGKSQAGDHIRGCSTIQACRNKYRIESSFGASSITFDDTKDPSVHPWGGLSVTRDSMLTVTDCFLDGMPLEVLQNVFQIAHARERERELLYPDACGGCGRGRVSHNGIGRAHAPKETCALHNAKLACEALVDFWAALGEETRCSLLRMKEEDFIERLMFRFDSKSFCQDCRRNVLREFKELKELKRAHKEPKCTRWFCSPDTVFRYEVSNSIVQAEWRDCFPRETKNFYRKFEWAIGSAEGTSDIFGFEDIGLSESVTLGGLDLRNFTDCFITVRASRRDGRCTELCAKAHAVKGELCVHRRLFVGDGYVSISKGESIERFFEHAEETEEEEDDDSLDKDGNEVEEGSRPQKHAKSPELAREFLLDASTVIFKEQVEKAFREGTARKNAHSIFICLALNLLEERVWIACKEITTLEKQKKLLEEEETEKREEEERRERKKKKEREKRMRRKELRSKNRNNSETVTGNLSTSDDVSFAASEEEKSCSSNLEINYTNDDTLSVRSSLTDMTELRSSADDCESDGARDAEPRIFEIRNLGTLNFRELNVAFMTEQQKSARRRLSDKVESSNATSRFSRTIAEPFERRRATNTRAALTAKACPRDFEHSGQRPFLPIKPGRSNQECGCTSKRFESFNRQANCFQNRSDLHSSCRNVQSMGPRKCGRTERTFSEKNFFTDDRNKPLLNGHSCFLENDHRESGQRTVSSCAAGNEKNDFQTCIELKAQVATDTKCPKLPNSCQNTLTSTAAKCISHSFGNGGLSEISRASRGSSDEITGQGPLEGLNLHSGITENDSLGGLASDSSELMLPLHNQEDKSVGPSEPASGPPTKTLNSISGIGCTADKFLSMSCPTAKFSNQKVGDVSGQPDLMSEADLSSKKYSDVVSCSSMPSEDGCSDNTLKENVHSGHTLQRVSHLTVVPIQKSIAANETPKYLPCSSFPISGRDPAVIQPSEALSVKSPQLLTPEGERHHFLQTSRSVSCSVPSVVPQESYGCYSVPVPQAPWKLHGHNGGLHVVQGCRYYVPRPATIQFQMYDEPHLYPPTIPSLVSIYPANAISIPTRPCGSNVFPFKDPVFFTRSTGRCNVTQSVQSSYHPSCQSSNGVTVASDQCPNKLVPSESLDLPFLQMANSLGGFPSSESSEFSLFHFGGPTSTNLGANSLISETFADDTVLSDLSDLRDCKVSSDQPSEANKARGAGEYSLFAATPQNAFGLF